MTVLNDKKQKKRVAIVVPLSTSPELTAEEKISLKQLRRYLSSYDKYMVAPKCLKIHYPDFEIKRFSNRFFGSAQAHLKLLLSANFYKAFEEYEYILIYHLDALVFSDRLEYWCNQGYDFIGAPWIKHKDAPYHKIKAYEDKVGNGGFSLRRVDSFIKIFTSKKYGVDPLEYWQTISKDKSAFVRCLNYPKKMLKHLFFYNNVNREASRIYGTSEERFLVTRAQHYYPDFNIAPKDVALNFAFECIPRYCYELNNHTLPFGCHAWQRYDREFWEPFLV
jgi:hypothetical protein